MDTSGVVRKVKQKISKRAAWAFIRYKTNGSLGLSH